MLSPRATLLLACALLAVAGGPLMARPRGERRAGSGRFIRPAATPLDFEVGLKVVGLPSIERGVLLEVSVQNLASGPRSFCMYYTPFEGFLNDILEVTDAAGARVPYPGPLASRPPPEPRDYVTLRPGEGRSVRFDLAQHYKLAPGVYQVRTGSGIDTLPRSASIRVEVRASGPALPVVPESLAVEVMAEPGASAQSGVFLRLSVSNLGTTPRRFCEYHTPFEGMRNHFIEVRDAAGREVRYRGMMAKRAAPDETDYYTLEPGHARTQRFALSEGYQFAPGAYRVRFIGGAISGLPASGEIPLLVAP